MSNNVAAQPQLHYDNAISVVPAPIAGLPDSEAGVHDTLANPDKEKEHSKVESAHEKDPNDFPKFDDMRFAQIMLILFR